MRINFLGTGTSVGVPFLGCPCDVCQSENPKNKRYRSSIFVDFDKNSTKTPELIRGLLVDSSPELRLQMLRLGPRHLEGIFYTHDHGDHVNGIDDLRPYNFIQKEELPIFGDDYTIKEIKTRFHYAFTNITTLEGGSPPRLKPNIVSSGEDFLVKEQKFTPISIHHGKRKILGLRVKNFAYLTDCSFIPDQSRALLKDLDVLVVSALRHTPHPNHFTVEQAIAEIEQIGPRRAFITHISHDLEHEAVNSELSKISSCQIQLAYDGLSIEI